MKIIKQYYFVEFQAIPGIDFEKKSQRRSEKVKQKASMDIKGQGQIL